MTKLQRIADQLRPLIAEWDAQNKGKDDPEEIVQARTVIQTADMEKFVASTMNEHGVKGLQIVEENGAISNELEWDGEGNVK